MDYIVNNVRAGLPPEFKVVWAALNFNHPYLAEAVSTLARQDIKHIIVMPYFLFEGKHSTEDIPALVEKEKHVHTDIAFTVTATLGEDKLLADLAIKRIRQATAATLNNEKELSATLIPEDIESRSMEIIESLLPSLECSNEERQVIKRIVHACGDLDIAHLVRFHPQATTTAINAIRRGTPIITDVKMVASGINQKKATSFGCTINCALDHPQAFLRAQQEKSTLTSAAIRSIGRDLSSSIVAIGNAPTALFALIDLIDNSYLKPVLIIGMPVGFVGAVESKTALVKRNIPFIIVEGNRGGSALAAATINALFNIA